MILVIVAIVLILFLGIGLYNANKLQHIHIQKTVHIQSDLQTTFDNVVYLKNFTKWSPFYEADPTQKVSIKGTDGQVGAQFHWEGNNGKDLGFQETKEIRLLKYIKMECDIQKPFKAKPTFEYSFLKTGTLIKVTQDFKLKSGLVDAFFMWLFGAKKDMEKMNARGMELLKIASEK
ncbi:hypothetical protein CLV91_0801 [Maribacter vaceletii]|uniref:Polyketide cyclase/dehydrase/lipid transport protein n=1 Tax=Maribacter vaceletii TaxID=1206816 RepID=A0A495EDV2_9FLAO|nr:hypothetical protein [Maribacter vaceletii]RKR14723.1 hypothetical protein CLV91_0801 [Maribacter vaceletii]